jgi:tyrosyl-tRNA synthetase
MFLAAKKVSPANKPVDVLLGDAHAICTGADPEVVARRANTRRVELRAIERLLGTHFNILLGSEIVQRGSYKQELDRVRSWIASNGGPKLTEYSVLGVVDDLYFHRQGKLKVGWSDGPTIRAGRGRHHEAEADLIAQQIDPAFRACYVRHGVTLDSKRPVGVPYTESVSTAHRLMLTGEDSGGFARKLSPAPSGKTRFPDVLDHLEIAVNEYETLVMPLEGDVVNKAEAIYLRLKELLDEGKPTATPVRLASKEFAGQPSSTPDVIDTLQSRGFIHQCTDLCALREHLSKARRIYCGFDPTASSLTIGNLMPLMALAHFQQAGHTPVIVLGGGTGLIGDPSGKTAERPLLPEEVVQTNLHALSHIFGAVLDFSYARTNRALLLDNVEWLSPLSLLDVLRNAGKHISANHLAQRDAIRDRMARNQGCSVSEFLYPVLQAIDFKVLLEEHDVTVQLGGADQWGNIVAGVELVRSTTHQTVFGITCPLLKRADGGKFGKTEAGPIWLTRDKTSPYHLFQFFMNTADSDAARLLRVFTFLPVKTIEDLERQQLANPEERPCQVALAREVTSLIHGKEAAQDAECAAHALFSGNISTLSEHALTDALSAAPTIHHSIADLVARPLPIVDLLCDVTAAPSKREARQLLWAGAVTLNGREVSERDRLAASDLLHGKFAAVRRGRKNWFVGIWE